MKTIRVEYEGYDFRVDSTILKVAEIFKGSHDGSGFWFESNLRDMIFSFKTKNQANGFSKAVNDAFKRKVKIKNY